MWAGRSGKARIRGKVVSSKAKELSAPRVGKGPKQRVNKTSASPRLQKLYLSACIQHPQRCETSLYPSPTCFQVRKSDQRVSKPELIHLSQRLETGVGNGEFLWFESSSDWSWVKERPELVCGLRRPGSMKQALGSFLLPCCPVQSYTYSLTLDVLCIIHPIL